MDYGINNYHQLHKDIEVQRGELRKCQSRIVRLAEMPQVQKDEIKFAAETEEAIYRNLRGLQNELEMLKITAV